MIKVESLTKAFKKRKALDTIELELSNESVALVGPNGAGKTTLLNILAGISRPTSGTVTVDSLALKDYLKQNRSLGYFQQDFSFFSHRKVKDQLNLLFDLAQIKEETKKVFLERWLQDLKLQQVFEKKISELSHGTAVKLNFLQTIIGLPEILIFDEPFSGLDVDQVSLIHKYLRKVKNETKTLIISSHDLHLLEDGLCDRFLFIKEGKMIASRTAQELQENYCAIIVSKKESSVVLEKAGFLTTALEHSDSEDLIVFEIGQKENKRKIHEEFAGYRILDKCPAKDIYRFLLA